MSAEFDLQELIAVISEKYDCHTIILYGSQARGDATPTSDYDLTGFSDTTEAMHDAYIWRGTYIDLFIKPTADAKPEALLHVREGIVLQQRDSFGYDLLHEVQTVYAAGPKPRSARKNQTSLNWIAKNLQRIRQGDIEADYRRAWLTMDLLEYYFVLRGEWFEGPKASFNLLRLHAPDVYQQFAAALKPGASLETIENLAATVVKI